MTWNCGGGEGGGRCVRRRCRAQEGRERATHHGSHAPQAQLRGDGVVQLLRGGHGDVVAVGVQRRDAPAGRENEAGGENSADAWRRGFQETRENAQGGGGGDVEELVRGRDHGLVERGLGVLRGRRPQAHLAGARVLEPAA